MSDLPQGWVDATLDEIAIVNPGRIGGISADTSVSFVPMPAVSDVDGEIVSPTVRPFAEVSKGYTQFQEGDVIFAKITPCMENGKIAVARSLESGVACGSTEFHVVRPLGENSPDYIWRFLRQKSYRNDAEASMTGAVGQRRVPAAHLIESRVPLPPLPEQRRIVAKIDSLTGKSRRARDHLNHIPRLVEKYKQAVLAAAFGGDLTDSKGVLLAPLGDFIRALDQGWSPKCEPEPAATGEWAVIKTTAIQPVEFMAGENKRLPPHLSPRPELTIQAGDVLITRAGPRSRVAISCVVTEDHPRLMLCDKAYRLRVDQDRTDPVYLTYMLNSPQCLGVLEAMKTGISDSGLNLTQGKFLELPIPAFPKDAQVKVVEKVRMALTRIDRLASEATSARSLVDRLDQAVLAKAFRGELVRQDPADEPASVLLERIRAERGVVAKARRGRRPKVAS